MFIAQKDFSNKKILMDEIKSLWILPKKLFLELPLFSRTNCKETL